MKVGISGKTAVNMEESQGAYSYQKYPIARVLFCNSFRKLCVSYVKFLSSFWIKICTAVKKVLE